MSVRWRTALIGGAATAIAVVGSAAAAHLAAGGELAGHTALGAFVLVAVLATLAARAAVRPTFPRLVAAALLAQPLLHAALGASGTPGHDSGHHRHHADGAHTGHTDTRMVVAHLVVTLVAAIALRWGMRWLRRLPALARALLLLPPRTVAAPRVVRVRFDSAAGHVGRDLAVLGVRADRGPPR